MIYFGDELRLRAGLVPLWKLWSHNHLQFCNKVYFLTVASSCDFFAKNKAQIIKNS